MKQRFCDFCNYVMLESGICSKCFRSPSPYRIKQERPVVHKGREKARQKQIEKNQPLSQRDLTIAEIAARFRRDVLPNLDGLTDLDLEGWVFGYILAHTGRHWGNSRDAEWIELFTQPLDQ